MSPKTNAAGPLRLDDVAFALSSGAEGFAQLAALLAAIRNESPEFSDARTLASLGWSVACDMQSFTADALAQMQKGGIQQ